MTISQYGTKEPDLFSDTAIIEVRRSLTSARGMRHGLVNLAMFLKDNEDIRGYLLLIDPGLSELFIEQELGAMKGILRQAIAERLNVVVAKSGNLVQGLDSVRQKDLKLVHEALAQQKGGSVSLPKPSKQEEVFLVILHQWFAGKGSITSRWIEETVGCTYRTAAAMIERLGNAIDRHSDRSISLRNFPEREWIRFLAVANRTRATMYFTDKSDQPRSPESLLRRLNNLNRQDIAVSGAIGAKHYYQDLDIIGAPRLDICVHCPETSVDLDFVKKLDPALERTSDANGPARLAIHFVRRNHSLFQSDEESVLWADPVECLIGLFDARLDLPGREFLEFLINRGVVTKTSVE